MNHQPEIEAVPLLQKKDSSLQEIEEQLMFLASAPAQDDMENDSMPLLSIIKKKPTLNYRNSKRSPTNIVEADEPPGL